MADPKPRLILIVEDQPEIADIEMMALEEFDVHIAHIAFPEQALEFLEEYVPDLLVLDIGLPEMSGWELLERVRARNLISEDTPVIITTAFTDPANRVVGKLQDVYRYITKPFSPADFQKTVVDLLDLQPR